MREPGQLSCDLVAPGFACAQRASCCPGALDMTAHEFARAPVRPIPGQEVQRQSTVGRSDVVAHRRPAPRKVAPARSSCRNPAGRSSPRPCGWAHAPDRPRHTGVSPRAGAPAAPPASPAHTVAAFSSDCDFPASEHVTSLREPCGATPRNRHAYPTMPARDAVEAPLGARSAQVRSTLAPTVSTSASMPRAASAVASSARSARGMPKASRQCACGS